MHACTYMHSKYGPISVCNCMKCNIRTIKYAPAMLLIIPFKKPGQTASETIAQSCSQFMMG